MICKNNLSFNLCNSLSFKKFFKKLGFTVRSSSFYRTELLNEESNNKINRIYGNIINKSFYLMLEETLNRKQQSVLNILVGVLNTKEYVPPKLLFSGIVKNTKATTLEQIVNKVIEPLLKSNFNKKNFKVFLSDGAAYCRKLGGILKENFNCLHVICVCHNIHNFSEYLRKKYKKVDNLISFLKRT